MWGRLQLLQSLFPSTEIVSAHNWYTSAPATRHLSLLLLLLLLSTGFGVGGVGGDGGVGVRVWVWGLNLVRFWATARRRKGMSRLRGSSLLRKVLDGGAQARGHGGTFVEGSRFRQVWRSVDELHCAICIKLMVLIDYQGMGKKRSLVPRLQ